MPIMIFPTSPGTFGTETSPFATENKSTSTSTASLVLSPPGFYMVLNGAHNTVRYSPDGTTRRTLIAASAGGIVFSDGQNVDIYNDATGGTTTFYTQILGNV